MDTADLHARDHRLDRSRRPGWRARGIRGSACCAVVLLATSLVAQACAERQAGDHFPRAEGANVIFVLVDALRADRLGSYGSEAATTPHLDALAKRAIVFRDAHANSASTVRSVASLFTSTLPMVHGIEAPPGDESEVRLSVLADEMVTAPEVFQAAGYHTAMVTGTGWITPEVNYDQGVDEYVLLEERADRNVIDSAIDFAQRQTDERFFLYLHLLDLHDYYHSEVLFERYPDLGPQGSEPLRHLEGLRPSEIYRQLRTEPQTFTPEDAQLLSRAYDRELQRTDALIGEFVDALASSGTLDDTLIVVSSDHGEQFLEHGHLVHGGDAFFSEVLAIPLLVAGPHVFDNRVDIHQPVSLVDVMPTLFDLVGVEVPEEAQGRSALAAEETLRPIVASNGRTWKVTTADWSYIFSERYEREELYRRSTDPDEQENLFTAEPEVAARMRRVLGHAIEDAREHPYARLRRSAVPMTDEVRKTLRSLGYLD